MIFTDSSAEKKGIKPINQLNQMEIFSSPIPGKFPMPTDNQWGKRFPSIRDHYLNTNGVIIANILKLFCTTAPYALYHQLN